MEICNVIAVSLNLSYSAAMLITLAAKLSCARTIYRNVKEGGYRITERALAFHVYQRVRMVFSLSGKRFGGLSKLCHAEAHGISGAEACFVANLYEFSAAFDCEGREPASDLYASNVRENGGTSPASRSFFKVSLIPCPVQMAF